MGLAISARCENSALELPSGELLDFDFDFTVAFEHVDGHARGPAQSPRNRAVVAL
jgi:hypothetical protein